MPESKPLGGGSYYKKEMLFRGVTKGTKGPNTNKKTDKLIYELAHPNTLMVVESLGHSQPHLKSGTLKAYNSPIGTTGLSFKRSDTIGHIALYDGPSEKHSFLTQGQQGLILVSVHRDSTGAMTFSPQLLVRPNKLVPNEHCTLHNGPLCQGITYNSKDRILAVGAFDKPDEMLILVENDLGLVIFRARLHIFGRRTLYSHSLRTNRSDDGLWSVGDRTANNTRIVHAVGDFNADGKQELVFRRVNQRLVH